MEQEGFRTMRTGPDPLGQKPSTPAQEALLRPVWGQQVGAWRELLDRCALNASRKRVRALRIATLRLQAALEFWLQEQAPNFNSVRAVKRWMSQGKKLRRALQPVRDADVSLQMLVTLHNPAVDPDAHSLRRSPSFLREVDALKSIVEQRLEFAMETLLEEIEDRRERLERRSRELERVLESATPQAEGAAAKEAWQLFAALYEEFKELDGSNLHAYRKGLKKVRYLAETGTGRDARRLAVSCKKMLNAAGNWHDCQELTKEAVRRLPGKDSGLAEVLSTITEKSLRRALAICRRSSVRLLKIGDGDEPSTQH